MRCKSGRFFEGKFRYDKTSESGEMKKVTELYVVEALSFGEAEKKLAEEMSVFVSGGYDITALKIAPYGEIFFSGDSKDDKWFRAKLQLIIIDDVTEKEKKYNVYYLVQAKNIESARKNIEDVMNTFTNDYSIAALVETKIMDVFEHRDK